MNLDQTPSNVSRLRPTFPNSIQRFQTPSNVSKWPLSDWFGSKRTCVWIKINRKMINRILFQGDLIRLRKIFSVRGAILNHRRCFRSNKMLVFGIFPSKCGPVLLNNKQSRPRKKKIGQIVFCSIRWKMF